MIRDGSLVVVAGLDAPKVSGREAGLWEPGFRERLLVGLTGR